MKLSKYGNQHVLKLHSGVFLTKELEQEINRIHEKSRRINKRV